MNSQTGLPLGFEFVDIEIINHKNENDVDHRWYCDHCSLFFLSKDKLDLHQKVHSFEGDTVNCKYCNKVLTGEESKECYSNKKCETCEYRCSQCPQRFLRQSSLLNHEKNHILTKKRRSRSTYNKPAEEIKGQVNNVSKKRKTLKINPDESLTEMNSSQSIGSPRKKRKTESDAHSPEKIGKTTTINISNRRSSRKALPHKDLSPDKSRLNEHVSKVPLADITDYSAKENPVNYKPFSCHVCGETFASDNDLLEHIKTHGETAAEAFKCKYCGDKFEDIYKMQYHLAICPFAEDELESSVNISCTPKSTSNKSCIESSPALQNGKPPVAKKRGRPFKYLDRIPKPVSENSENNTHRAHGTRSRQRKSVVNDETSTRTSLSRKPRRSVKSTLNVEVVDGVMEDCGESLTDSLDVSGKKVDESGSDDESRRKIHQCPHPSCGLKFTREKAMLCHYRNHEDSDGTVKCFKCGIPFDDDHDLTTHIKECKGVKEENDDDYSEAVDQFEEETFIDQEKTRGRFMCKICGRKYKTNDGLKSHECIVESNPLVKNTLSSKKHRCNLCEMKFENELEENNHMISHARAEVGFPCNVCFLICRTEKLLQSHYKEVKHNIGGSSILHDLLNSVTLFERIEENSANYHNINIKYRNPCTNDNTMKSSNTKENKWYFSCITCEQNFESESSVIDHEKIHLVSCPICEITLDNFNFLKEHVQKNHVKGLRSLQCKICNSTKCNETELTNHILVHANRQDSDIDNTILDISRPLENVQKRSAILRNRSIQSSEESISVRKHRASYYRALEETRVFCPICQKSFSENAYLKLHLLNKHVNQSESYVCCVCQKIETSAKDLVEHILTHKPDTQSRLTSERKRNLVPVSDVDVNFSSNSANNSIMDDFLHDDSLYQGIHFPSKNKFYELTNNNITVCGVVPENSDVCDKIDDKLLDLPIIKGAICTVCAETMHTPTKLKSHKNVLVYC